jgi:putative selenate reductase molybdopterin-binding subunit
MTLLEIAEKLNISLEELLAKNLVKKGYRLEILKQLGEGKEGLAQKISSCGLPSALEKGLKRYNSWKIKNDNKSDIVKGKGLAVMMQGSGIPGIDAANAIIKMLNDGTFMLYIGGADLGTGEDTVAAKIAAEELGVELKHIAVTSADTDTTPFDKGSYASSGTFFTGNAAYKAANNMKKIIITEAAKILKIPVKDVKLFPVGKVGTKTKNMTYQELACISQSGTGCGQLITAGAFTTDKAPIPYAAHFAEISVNKKTGFVKVNKYYAIHDCGIPINPDLAAGQVYGAILKTIGHTFYEALEFDKNGKSLNSDFTGYPIPVIKDMPEEFDVELLEVDDDITPYVGKSISEIACNGASACIGMALYKALGIYLREWPFRPEKILQALDNANSK